jgi:hypothetical protein
MGASCAQAKLAALIKANAVDVDKNVRKFDVENLVTEAPLMTY